jgi:hypothetical protein
MDFARSSQLNETNKLTKGDFMGDSERSTNGAVRVPLGNALGRAACLAAGLVLGLSLAADRGHAAETKDMGKHPDFSGLWFPAGFGKRTPNPLPFTPKAKKEHDDYVAHFTADDDPGRYCIAPGMPRAIWGAPFSVEIFMRPQDMTIIWEGYNMYRKIYIEGHSRPDPVINTQMGYAVGHWEGDTLVVHTDHLKEYPYMNKFPTSSSAVIDERLHVEERDMNGEKHKFLVDELTLTDPKVYTEPVHVTSQLMYRPDIQVLEYSCSDELWEAYLDKRGLTPPDLDGN